LPSIIGEFSQLYPKWYPLKSQSALSKSITVVKDNNKRVFDLVMAIIRSGKSTARSIDTQTNDFGVGWEIKIAPFSKIACHGCADVYCVYRSRVISKVKDANL